MRRLTMLLLSAVAFAGLTTSADAADKPVVRKARPIVKAPPPPPPPVPASSGFYAGVVGGYGWNRATFIDPTGSISTAAHTGMVGATFGYNVQSGAWVYGIETDISGGWDKGTNNAGPPCLGCEVELLYLGTVRGRIGYAVGNALPYFTGGFAYGGVKIGTPALPKDTDDKTGWTVGGGVEYALGGLWSVKAEYLYFELDTTACEPTNCGAAVRHKFQGNLARFGVNYRF